MNSNDPRHKTTVKALSESERAVSYLAGAIWAEADYRTEFLLGTALATLKQAVAALEAAGVKEPPL